MLATIIALALSIAFAALAGWILWRTRGTWPAVPAWDWAILIKVGALAASIGGAGILTLLYWQGHIERHTMLQDLIGKLAGNTAQAKEDLAAIAISLVEGWNRDQTGLLIGILITLVGVGFLMTPRKAEVEAGWFKMKFDGGDASPSTPEGKAAAKVAAAAEEQAAAVEQEAAADPEGDLPPYARP